MRTRLRRFWREERGATLVLMGLMLGVLLGMGSLVTDVGVGYWNRRMLQNAVDGAAMAGAWQLPADTAAATSEAQAYANSNGVPTGQIQSITFTCTFQSGSNCPDTITVVAQRSLPPLLAGVIGQTGLTVRTQATAIVAALQPRQLVPWGVTAGTEGPGEVTLKAGVTKADKGNFFALDFPDSSGGKDYSYYIKNGYDGTVPDPVGPSDPWPIKTETGNLTGPTLAPVLQLMAAEPGNDCRDPSGNPYAVLASGAPDLNNIACPRVITVPLIKESWDAAVGKSTVNVVGFAAFRIDGVSCTAGTLNMTTGECKPKGFAEIQGHFLDYVSGTGSAKYRGPLDYSGQKGVFFWQ